MKVSVIIPAYQAEKYISVTLQSIINQTFQDKEIIIVNDGSTDGTLNIIESYAKKFEYIKVFNQPNQGIVRTRARALAEASGEYILMVDDDDWIVPTAIEKLYAKAKEEEADLVFFHHIHVYGEVGYYNDNFKEEDLIKNEDPIRRAINCQSWPVSMTGKLMKRSYLLQIRYSELPSISYFEDQLVSVILSLYNPKVAWINEYLYYWNIHSDSTSSVIRDNFAKEQIEGYECLIKVLKERELYEEYKMDLNERIKKANIWMQERKNQNLLCAKQMDEFYNRVKIE